MARRFTARLRQRQWGLLLALGVGAGLAYLLARNAGLPPFIFGDELIYSTFARLIPLADASVPSYSRSNARGPAGCVDPFIAGMGAGGIGSWRC